MAKKRIAIFLAVVIVLIFVFFPNFSKYRKLSMECDELRDRIKKLKSDNQRLEEEKYKLEHDIEYIEKRAREKLGVVKKDEIPYKIIEE
jgi:cell division protein FtsL